MSNRLIVFVFILLSFASYQAIAIENSKVTGGIILFDEGREVTRVASMLFPFHFDHLLRFGLSKNHQKYSRYGELLRARQEILFAQGIDTDVGSPDDW